LSIAPAVRRPSSLRRWLRRVLVLGTIGIVIVGAFIGGQVYRRLADKRLLQETVADLDVKSPRWRLEDIEADRVAIPDAENSATVIRAAHARIRPLAPPPTDDSIDLLHLDPAAALTDEQLRAVIDLVESAESAIAPALRLEQFPRGRHPITHSADGIGTRLPHIGDIDDVHKRVLLPLLLMHLHEGDTAAAVRDWVCIAHLGRSLGDEPYGVSQATRAARAGQAVRDLERLLGQVVATDGDLTTIQGKITDDVANDPWPLFLRGERAVWHRLMVAFQSGMFPASNVRRFLANGEGGRSLSRIEAMIDQTTDSIPPDVAAAHAGILKRSTHLLSETANLPWHARTAPILAANQSGVPAVNPADYRQVLIKFQRNYALLRSALIAVAAERCRLKHGDWPATPAELVPAFLPELPIDPFDGQPLRYKRLPDGVVVYSVGPDGVDDGGQISAAPGQQPMTDVGIRWWDVTRRRQAPPQPASDAQRD
jgi:hypothetical protein